MDFMILAAAVCREFTRTPERTSSQIISVKNDNKRDVVTALDLRLHQVVHDYVVQADPSTVLLSEEDNHFAPEGYWSAKSLVILDPLDGSNNYALSLPGFGLMATHLIDRCVASSLVVLPELDLYMVWDSDQLTTSQPVTFARCATSATIYYAYPPNVGRAMAEGHTRILNFIEDHSSGLYRSGSAGVGLFHLLRGAHLAFVGHRVRVWDVLSYLPLLSHLGFTIRYRIDGFAATLVTGHDQETVREIERTLKKSSNVTLHPYHSHRRLVIGD